MKPVCVGASLSIAEEDEAVRGATIRRGGYGGKKQSEFRYEVQLHYRQNRGSLTFLSWHHYDVASSPRRSLLVFFS